jgi:YD repeat-containing protein
MFLESTFATTMMKLLQAVLIVAVAFCCQKKIKHDRLTSVGNRKIKMVLESVHDPIIRAGKFESSQKLSKDSFFYESYFDKKGRLVRKNTFNLKAVLVSKIVFNYDKRGNNTDRLVYHSDGSLSSKSVSTFDSKNRLIEVCEFDAFGKIISKKVTTHDSVGHRILTSYEKINRGIVKTEERVFDNDENNVENSYFSNETLTLREIQEYDRNGNLLETIKYYPLEDEQSITRFKYDEQNNKIEEAVLKNNLVTTKTIYRYDDKNILTETFRYGVKGTLEVHYRYVFEFDADGNWTKRIDLFNDKPTAVLVRRIEYY